MKRPDIRSLTRAFLLAVWVIVVMLSLWLAVTRSQEYGYFTHIAIGIASCMLTIFALEILLPNRAKQPWGERLGNLAVGGLILCAIVVLSMAAYRHRTSPLIVLLLGLFLITFVRIFIDWVKHFLNPTPRK